MTVTEVGRCLLLSLVFLAGGGFDCANTQAQSSRAPEPSDWFAGDAHVHRGIGCGRSNEKEMLSPKELLEMMRTNNLSVVSVLADTGNGEMKYAERDIPLITRKDNA